MYASIDDLEVRLEPSTLIALADDDNNGVADTDVINAAIIDADSLIDSYLLKRYTLPLDSTPAVIKSISCVLAINNLFARRKETVSPEHVERYRSAMGVLEKISLGEIDIGDAPDVFEHSLPQTTSDEDDRIFDTENLKGF